MRQLAKQFALCVDNQGYEVDMIIGKVYAIIPDARAEKDDFVRIVDESGEDYLYHKSHFVFVDFPSPVRKVILGAMSSPNKPLQTDERRVKVMTKRQHSPRAASRRR
jgi:hypothetical protein